MTSLWVLLKTYYTLLLKKCLRPCPGLSMYLSERINWIISSFPQWISKILFVLGSWGNFGSLGCRNGECPFFCVSILFLCSVFCNNASKVEINITYFLCHAQCAAIARRNAVPWKKYWHLIKISYSTELYTPRHGTTWPNFHLELRVSKDCERNIFHTKLP